jgi:ATP-binding cassette, subfamily B (MDR/TAP), member 1
VLKFGDNFDYFLMTSSFLSAVGAGIAMPLMFLVFGRLVGDLTSYFTPGSAMSKEKFMQQIEKNTYVRS